MKTRLVVVCILAMGLLWMASPVLAQQQIQESAMFMETLVTQIEKLLQADNVLGTPLDFNGTKVVPVVGYCFGFGAGSGSGTDQKGQGVGAGGGAGGGIMPTSILVITPDGDVKVMTAKKGIISDIMSSITPIALEAIKAKQQEKQAETPEPETSQDKSTE
ncbi:hypothetical protein GF339_07335 [candidate division KSB3 bacterium]|uniref:Sporulation protein YtfJ n=1 Tax=candidate division KSB3 bacterium TaxID=2044937 RepID=A0A9D5JUY1_9BACT|nr:hypothetical protein [candidate division KSB3 bacterium]MBD3324382.1 hypothetical protein [candidate division KSB3 bacterium]